MRSLLAQDYPHFEVIVVDDRSHDDTAAIVARIASEDPRVQLIGGKPLPAGWVGKPWALHQGARRARGEWLLFTDADTIHEANAATASLVYARARNLDVLSVLTEQLMVTAAERILLPSILWIIAFSIGSLDAINDPANESALLTGNTSSCCATSITQSAATKRCTARSPRTWSLRASSSATADFVLHWSVRAARTRADVRSLREIGTAP